VDSADKRLAPVTVPAHASTYRSAATTWFAAGVGLFFIAYVWFGIVCFVGGGKYQQSHRFLENMLGIACVSVGVAGLAWTALRLRKMGVVTSDDGVVVRNRLKTFHLEWQDIDCFKFGNELDHQTLLEALATPSLQPYAVMRSGKNVLLAGLTSIRTKKSRQKVRRLLDALNAEVAQHKSRSNQH
jgi:hypothetical protein